MKKPLFKIPLSILAILIMAIGILFLNKTAKTDYTNTPIIPVIVDSPSYIECSENEILNFSFTSNSSFTSGGIQLLLVNLSNSSKGNIYVTLKNDEETIYETQIMASDIIVGEWNDIPGYFDIIENTPYTLSIYADESQPFFIKSAINGYNNTVFTNIKCSLMSGDNTTTSDSLPSIGFIKTTPRIVKYKDIFYFSIPILCLLVLSALLLIWVPFKSLTSVTTSATALIINTYNKLGTDIFLIVLFIYLALDIYINSYLNGVNISADSSGYLREAVNLYAGNGMNYDGLAGYNSWFANWPILYPLFIFITMLITRTNAYLASKILTLLIIAITLIILRLCFNRNAFLYSIVLLNLGFIEISYYTWSESLFMLWLLLFGISFEKILSLHNDSSEISLKHFIYLGSTCVLCFLTRYFGIFLWFVIGAYIAYLLLLSIKERNHLSLAVKLIITAFISGILSISYLVLNKIMNGMPSGVSRSDWWDDYESLTNDLVQSLLTEFFNIFHIAIPDFINNYSYSLKALLLILILMGVCIFIVKNISKIKGKLLNPNMVFIIMATIYYGMFIVIRYFSSMDTLYFRFFEPATFLLTIGIIGIFLELHETFKKEWGMRFFGITVLILLIFSTITLLKTNSAKLINTGKSNDSGNNSYYATVTATWDEAYKDIPHNSVVIFSDLDYRSEYYRPDVIGGTINPEDTIEILRERYYGSHFMCIRTDYAEEMINSGIYDNIVSDSIKDALNTPTNDNKYCCISLN